MVNIIMLSDNDKFNKRFEKAFQEFVGNLISFKITDTQNIYEDIKSAELCLVEPNNKKLDVKRLPQNCAYAWFTKEKNLSLETSMCYVYMYQNIFEICQSLLKIIENYRNQLITKSDFFQNTKIISFISCGGKTGATTIAEGFTTNKIHKEKSVLYVILSPFGKVNFLHKNQNMEDKFLDKESIELLSSRNSNKLEIINGFKNLEMALNFDISILNLIVSKAKNLEYDYLILDTNFNFIDIIPTVLKVSNIIALVTDGSQNSLEDFEKSNEFINSIDQKYDDKVMLIHNKYQGTYPSGNTLYNSKSVTKIAKLSEDFTIDELINETSNINL